ncbi:hypothetical protein BT69DRAFT_889483 [Atractiella rhizophila]|nr:hypothetical protein BT69DRAFT_889306 [Atractiella rhizophila]KAH8915391.1 hypothetical protein BT69DRAFT_889483 [Atractiella rhizophila]
MAVSLPTDIVGLICYHLYRLALPTANQGIDPTLVPIQPKIAVHSPNGRLPLATEFAPSDFEVVKRTFRHLTELGSRVWFLEARKYQWEFVSIKYPRGMHSVLLTLDRHPSRSRFLLQPCTYPSSPSPNSAPTVSVAP